MISRVQAAGGPTEGDQGDDFEDDFEDGDFEDDDEFDFSGGGGKGAGGWSQLSAVSNASAALAAAEGGGCLWVGRGGGRRWGCSGRCGGSVDRIGERRRREQRRGGSEGGGTEVWGCVGSTCTVLSDPI